MHRLEKLVVFDICDTLYRSNTTFDFIRFALERQKKSWKSFLLKLYTTKYSPLFIGFYLLQKINKKDVCKTKSLGLLKGTSKQTLDNLAEQFREKYLSKRKVVQTHQMLHQFKAEDATIVFLSASIDPVVRAIANAFGVTFFCSDLAYQKEVFTGAIAFEMTGKKQSKLATLGLDGQTELTVITDNFTDKKLMRLAKHRYAVIYSEEARKYWSELSPKFIDLSSTPQK